MVKRSFLTLTILILICGCTNPNVAPSTAIHPSSTPSAGTNISPTLVPATVTVNTPTLPSPTLTPIPAPTITLPPQGLYDSCVPSYADCLNHLNVLAEKGFKLIVNYGQLYGDAKSQLAYADRAQSLGMKVIWAIVPHFDRPAGWMITKYPDLSAGSGCTDNNCLITYFVNIVKDHPATWGYYVADEVKPPYYSQLKEWTETVKQADPNHPRLIVTSGSNDPMEQYYYFYSYMGDTAEVIGPDYYPYGYIDDGTSLTRFTGETARHAQLWADKLNKQSVIVLQAFSVSRYSTVPLCLLWPLCAPFPSYQQMKEQRDQTILNSHPAIILWWTYADILKTDNPAKHLDDLAAAAFSPLPETTSTPISVNNECVPNWNCEDIGNPITQGNQTKTGDFWTIGGAGWDIWSTAWVRADQFHYVWQDMETDGYFSAQVNSQSTPNLTSKAGIMIRKTFDPISPYYAILITSDNRVKVQIRSAFGEDTKELAHISAQQPLYLKITRDGTSYSSYTSEDGITWVPIPNSTIDITALTGNLMAGFAVTSGDENQLGIATFDNVITSFFAP
jgi:hypothetical protein